MSNAALHSIEHRRNGGDGAVQAAAGKADGDEAGDGAGTEGEHGERAEAPSPARGGDDERGVEEAAGQQAEREAEQQAAGPVGAVDPARGDR